MCQVGWRTTFAERRQLRAPEPNGAIRPGQWPCEWQLSGLSSATYRLAIGTVAGGRSSMNCVQLTVGGHHRSDAGRATRRRRWCVRRRDKVPSEMHTQRMPLSVPFAREAMPVTQSAMREAGGVARRRLDGCEPFVT